MLTQITPLILTLNEAHNIERTLKRLSWAKDIVVVDSGSTDGTRELLDRYPKVRVVERAFTTHAEQWNFGLEQTDIRTEWVLALDADYVLPEALVEELASLSTAPEVVGYQTGFIYCVEGRPLRGTAYPPKVVLYRKAAARYVQDGHTQHLRVDGQIHALKGRIVHDDRKPLGQWLAAQARYMHLEAEKLLATPLGELGAADRLRCLIVVAPAAMLFFCLFARGNIFDGRAGLFYALQRATAEAILSLYLLQRKLGVSDREQTRR
jgi:glycosyltransferase involved in cell wall biosynthesis